MGGGQGERENAGERIELGRLRGGRKLREEDCDEREEDCDERERSECERMTQGQTEEEWGGGSERVGVRRSERGME